MPKRSVCWVILSIIFVCCFLGTAGAAEEVTA